MVVENRPGPRLLRWECFGGKLPKPFEIPSGSTPAAPSENSSANARPRECYDLLRRRSPHYLCEATSDHSRSDVAVVASVFSTLAAWPPSRESDPNITSVGSKDRDAVTNTTCVRRRGAEVGVFENLTNGKLLKFTKMQIRGRFRYLAKSRNRLPGLREVAKSSNV